MVHFFSHRSFRTRLAFPFALKIPETETQLSPFYLSRHPRAACEVCNRYVFVPFSCLVYYV